MEDDEDEEELLSAEEIWDILNRLWAKEGKINPRSIGAVLESKQE